MQEQPAWWAVHRFADDELTRSWVVGRFDKRPDLAGGVAETGEGTKFFSVTEGHGRPVIRLGLPGEGNRACRLFTVEADGRMGPVAERLGLRPPAPAEFVRRGRRKRFALHPIPGDPFLVGRDDLDRKGHRPPGDVRTRSCHNELLAPGNCRIFRWYPLI